MKILRLTLTLCISKENFRNTHFLSLFSLTVSQTLSIVSNAPTFVKQIATTFIRCCWLQGEKAPTSIQRLTALHQKCATGGGLPGYTGLSFSNDNICHYVIKLPGKGRELQLVVSESTWKTIVNLVFVRIIKWSRFI